MATHNKIDATDLQNAPIALSFRAYLVPAMLGMVIKALYIIIDTIFVGRGVGSIAIGAMAMTVPFFSIFTAVTLTIGIGGATLMAISRGKGDNATAQKLFEQSILLITIMEIILISLGIAFLPQLISLMGATGELASLTYDYMIIMLPFFFIHGLSMIVVSFVRNDSNPRLAMYAILSSAIINIILDYIFIFPLNMGIKGAALATGISQMVTLAIILYHFKLKSGVLRLKRFIPTFTYTKSIINIGLPTLFVESTTAITTIAFNKVILANYTDLHVAVYGIINNVGLFVLFLLVGVGQACQPIISYNHGANRKNLILETVKLGQIVAISIGVVTMVVMFVASSLVASMFTKDDKLLIELSSYALKVYFIATPIMGFNAVIASLFQSVGQPWNATIISILRGFLFVVLGLLVLPIYINETGVWASVLFAELLTIFVSVYMLMKYINR